MQPVLAPDVEGVEHADLGWEMRNPDGLSVRCKALLTNFRAVVLGYVDADFAGKSTFCSILRDLQDLRTFAPLQNQNKSYFFGQSA